MLKLKLNDYHKKQVKRVQETLKKQRHFSAEEIYQMIKTAKVGQESPNNEDLQNQNQERKEVKKEPHFSAKEVKQQLKTVIVGQESPNIKDLQTQNQAMTFDEMMESESLENWEKLQIGEAKILWLKTLESDEVHGYDIPEIFGDTFEEEMFCDALVENFRQFLLTRTKHSCQKDLKFPHSLILRAIEAYSTRLKKLNTEYALETVELVESLYALALTLPAEDFYPQIKTAKVGQESPKLINKVYKTAMKIGIIVIALFFYFVGC